MEKICKNCEYWQDYNKMVFAVVEGVKTNHSCNHIELRWCKFKHHPSIPTNGPIYTDEKTYCSEWKETK